METFWENFPSFLPSLFSFLGKRGMIPFLLSTSAVFSFTVRTTIILCAFRKKKCCQLNYNHTIGYTMKPDIRDKKM